MTQKDLRPMVLLAEDDADLRQVIASRLTREGMRVVEVDDGLQLRDYLQLCRPGGDLPEPDAVVTDVRMPGETGLEALLHAEFHHGPVVLMSSCIDAEVTAYGSRPEVAAVFEKPFALKDLVFALRRVLPTPSIDPRAV